jgi:hypothetical protein
VATIVEGERLGTLSIVALECSAVTFAAARTRIV